MATIQDLHIKRLAKLFKKDIAYAERMLDVYDIFKQQFGEDVMFSLTDDKDLDDYYFYSSKTIPCDIYDDFFWRQPKVKLIIHIPRETVENEMGLKTTIYDLFIKLHFRRNGSLMYGISYLKSTYTENQLHSRYIHSHCPSLSTDNLTEWHGVCTGSGPINDTVSQLAYPTAMLELWYGFIAELRQIVRVESLTGGPYMRIENIIGPYKRVHTLSQAPVRITPNGMYDKELIISYIKSGRLKLGNINRKFCLGCSFIEWLTDFTEYAKAWAAANSITITSLERVLIKDGNLCVNTHNGMSESEVSRLVGKPIINFNGTQYNLKIIDADASREQRTLIPPAMGVTVLKQILNTLNYWYNRPDANSTENPDRNIVFA